MGKYIAVILLAAVSAPHAFADNSAEAANPFFTNSGISENPDGTFYVGGPAVRYNGSFRNIHFDSSVADFLCTQFDFARAASGYQTMISPYYPTVGVTSAGQYTYYSENTFPSSIKVFSGLLCLR